MTLALLSSVAVGAAQSRDAEQGNDQVKESQRATAKARFVVGDTRGALDALNAIGEPRIGEIKIEGRVRSRQDVVADYLGAHTGDMLTWARLTRVERRLHDLPIASAGKVRYDLGDGSVIVRPILVERDRFYEGRVEWIPVGIRALILQDVVMPVSYATGHGDVWRPSARWRPGQPRVALDVAAPAPGRLPGVVRFDTLWQTAHFERHVAGGASDAIEEDRGRAGAALSDWLTGWLRWEGGAAVDRIASVTYLSLNGSLDVRAFDDRMATVFGGSWYTSEANRTATGDVVVSLRSTTRDDRLVFLGRGGVAAVGDRAPLSLWPAASSGGGQVALLRAHSLHQAGIVTGEVFGQQLAFIGAESVYPLPTRMGPTFLGVAGFVDAARAWSGFGIDSSTLHVDVGTGIRMKTSRWGGRVRLDLAYGLRDGRVHVSAGYVQPWGKR